MEEFGIIVARLTRTVWQTVRNFLLAEQELKSIDDDIEETKDILETYAEEVEVHKANVNIEKVIGLYKKKMLKDYRVQECEGLLNELREYDRMIEEQEKEIYTTPYGFRRTSLEDYKRETEAKRASTLKEFKKLDREQKQLSLELQTLEGELQFYMEQESSKIYQKLQKTHDRIHDGFKKLRRNISLCAIVVLFFCVPGFITVSLSSSNGHGAWLKLQTNTRSVTFHNWQKETYGIIANLKTVCADPENTAHTYSFNRKNSLHMGIINFDQNTCFSSDNIVRGNFIDWGTNNEMCIGEVWYNKTTNQIEFDPTEGDTCPTIDKPSEDFSHDLEDVELPISWKFDSSPISVVDKFYKLVSAGEKGADRAFSLTTDAIKNNFAKNPEIYYEAWHGINSPKIEKWENVNQGSSHTSASIKIWVTFYDADGLERFATQELNLEKLNGNWLIKGMGGLEFVD